MTPEPLSARVSVLERLTPSIGFAIAALSGSVGALMIFRMFRAMRQAETAGLAAFLGATAEIEFVVGVVLIFAVVMCAVGTLVSVIRLFTVNTTASPPGILFLLLGLISLVPPFTIHYVLHWMKEIALSREPADGGISAVAEPVTYLSYFAIASGFLLVVGLLVFSIVPFSSRTGRKASTIVGLILVEVLIAVMAGIFFWEARMSITERDMDWTDEYTRPMASPTPTIDPYVGEPDDIANDENRTGDSGADNPTGSISGGVLNGRAIDLPQPAYPPAARAVRATGSVSVQVTVNEQGEVVSASAVSGHPLLRAAAVQAARRARFAPAKLSGRPVKVTGVLTYKFE